MWLSKTLPEHWTQLLKLGGAYKIKMANAFVCIFLEHNFGSYGKNILLLEIIFLPYF